MGLHISVYTDGTDSTGKGVSGQGRKNLTLVSSPGFAVSGPFEPDDEAPAVKFVLNQMGEPVIVPVDQPEGMIGPMFGGNYGGTSDSRFRQALGSRAFYGAVPIHDRFETQEQYDALSK